MKSKKTTQRTVFGVKNAFRSMLCIGLLSQAGLLHAQYLQRQGFNDPVVTNPSPMPSAWYVDRYAPYAFENATLGAESVLKMSIHSNDAAANRPGGRSATFYNTQGRKFDMGENIVLLKSDLYIPADWATKHRRADIWGTAVNASSPASPILYPIIGFANTEGNNPTLRYYDNGTWINIPAPVTYDTWYSFTMELTGDSLEYFVNDVKVGAIHANTGSYFTNVILQGYNFADAALEPASQDFVNTNYDIYWDNVVGLSRIQNSNSGQYYSTIQNAVNDASAHDVITVGAGKYQQAFTITKPLTLKGAQYGVEPRPSKGSDRSSSNANESVIEGLGSQQLVTINADSVIFDGFTLRQTTTTGSADIIGSPDGVTHTALTIANNIVHEATDEGIQIRAFNNATIERNYVYNTKGDGINMCLNTNGVNQVIRSNDINNSLSDYGVIYLYDIKNVEVYDNVINTTNNIVGLYNAQNINVHHNNLTSSFSLYTTAVAATGMSGVTGNISFSNNAFRQIGTTAATYMRFVEVFNPVTNVEFTNNSFTTDPSVVRPVFNIRVALAEHIRANCNWYGTTDEATIASRVTGVGAANVTYFPALNSGTNTQPLINGFTPGADACRLPLVTNTTRSTYYSTIAAALSHATTVAGDTIVVASGSFKENLTISKGVVLLGNNANINPNSGTRNTETVIKNSKWDITAAAVNAVINGFKFESDTNATLSAVQTAAKGTVRISNNIFSRQASATTGTNSYAILTNSGLTDTLMVENNKFTSTLTVSNGSLTTSNGRVWRAGVYANPAGANGSIRIRDNHFEKSVTAVNFDGLTARDAFSGNTLNNNGTHLTILGSATITMPGNTFGSAGTLFNNRYATDALRLDVSASTISGYNDAVINEATKISRDATFNNSGSTRNMGYIKWYPNNLIITARSAAIMELADFVAFAKAGDTILINNSVALNATKTADVNKTLTITGRSSGTKPTVNGSVAVTGSYFALITAANTSVANIRFNKTDKTGPQNLFGIRAANVTINNCDFTGQYVAGDADVSRAVELSSTGTGFTFSNNTVTGLRQPGYLQSSGSISNNTVSGTRGFVLDVNADLVFSGNSFSDNAVDIAILPGVNPSLFPDLFVLSSANHNAYVEDQRINVRGVAEAHVAVTGNDNTNIGTAASPYLTIARGIERILPTGTVHIASGTYNEDVNIAKTITLQGANAATTKVIGLNSGSAHTINIAANNVKVSNITVTRDYGASVSDWYAAVKSQGITINQNISGTVLDSLIVSGNRNGIYGQIIPNTTITNCLIEDNRTGIHFGRNVSGSIVENNIIRNNFTHGVLFNADFGAPVNISNVKVRNNAIYDNWYSGINYQNNTGQAITSSELNGYDASCNWYGSGQQPVVSAVATGEPGYTSQVPSQFGGTNPGVGIDIAGTEAYGIAPVSFASSGTESGTAFTVTNCTDMIPYIGLVNCTQTGMLLSDDMVATLASGATSYRFELTHDGITTEATSSDNTLPVSSVSAAAPGDTIWVRVKAEVGGSWGYYGAQCYVVLHDLKTQLATSSCGAGSLLPTSVITADAVDHATEYTFQVMDMSNTVLATLTSGNNTLVLSNAVFAEGASLKIAVKAQAGGAYGDYGDVCTINMATIRTKLAGASCGKRNYLGSETISVNAVAVATSYKIVFIDSASHSEAANIAIASTTTNPVNTISGLLKGHVYKTVVITVIGSDEYAGLDTCTIRIADPKTASLNCGASVTNTGSFTAQIPFDVAGTYSATSYKFNFTNTLTNAVSEYTTVGTNVLAASSMSSTLFSNTAYALKITALVDGQWLDFTTPCNVTLARSGRGRTTSIDGVEMLTHYVYPNPAHNVLNIEAEFIKGDKLVMQSIDGKVMQNVAITEDSGKYSLDVSGYAAGTYIISWITEEGVQIIKFIKQ